MTELRLTLRCGEDGYRLCGWCDGPVQWWAGETLVDGENRWSFEHRCAGCGDAGAYCGRGLLRGRDRERMIELAGSWTVRIEAAPTSAVPVMQLLRVLYGGSLASVKQQVAELTGAGLIGTRGEAELVRYRLAGIGVDSAVGNVRTGSQDDA